MVDAARSVHTAERRQTQTGYPEGGLRFDRTAAALSALFLAGLLVDGWAHFHGQVDESFFTPWHFLFYGAFGIVSLFFAGNHLQNTAKGYAFTRALPKGYWLSLIGVVIFALGGVGDMIWHTLFGIEEGTEALLSPTHIMLAAGMALVFTGPARAAWNRARETEAAGGETPRGWRQLAPMLVCMTLLLSLLMFFTSYANPLAMPLAMDGIFEFGPDEQVQQLYVMNADGSLQTRLTSGVERGALWGAWSPDGERIVYSRGLGHEGSDLYIINADGSDPVQLTSTPGEEKTPSWSPDGSQIVYVAGTEGAEALFVVNVEGDDPVQITESSGGKFTPVWSPDGTKITFSMRASNTEADNLWVVNADGTEAVQLTTDGGSWGPAWSPDGTKIAFNTYLDNSTGIYVINADGSNLTRIVNTNDFEAYPAWSPDGTAIIYVLYADGLGEIYRVPASGVTETEQPVNLSNNSAILASMPRYSPDGSRILFSANGQSSGGEMMAGTLRDFGVTAFLLTAILISGVVLVLAGRWTLPFGAFTLLLTLSTFTITLLIDSFYFIPGALIAGLVADVVYQRIKPSVQNARGLMLFAFIVPALYMGLYFIPVQLFAGIGWNIHVWTGSVFLSGVVGMAGAALLSTAARAPRVE